MRTVAAALAWLVLSVGPLGAAAQPTCGEEAPCELTGGSYFFVTPDGWDGQSPLPAIVFFHGHRSSGRSALRGSVRKTFGKAGYVVIAPNGQVRPGADYFYWPARPMETPMRDDVAFAQAVVEDVAREVPLDRQRILVAGFSAGGSMAWMIACHLGDEFAGYVSVAGALRRPAPEDRCPGGPARMLHFHGFGDTQVPLEGRRIRDWHQGDVFESFSLMRETNGCRSNPHAVAIGDPFSCRVWNRCTLDADLRLCVHDGGHGLPKGWARAALDWFEGLPTGQ